MRVEIVSTSFPPPPYPAGQPQTLQVQARITFPASAQPALTSPIEVVVNGQGVNVADATTGFVTQGPANSQGLFSTTVTPTGTAPVVLRARARINDPAFPELLGIFADALVGGGLVVSPSSVTLAPGQTQQFTAMLNGQPHAVTWSVSGGVATITPGGLFEAFTPPSTPVTVVVTATSTTNPNLTGTATVTVQGTGSALFNDRQGRAAAVDMDNNVVSCHDDNPLGAGATFPAEVSAECPRSAARLTARLSGAGTLIFDATARASAANGFQEAIATALLNVTASRDLHVTMSLNSGWATLTGELGRCEVQMRASYGSGFLRFDQRTGQPPGASDLTRTLTLPAGEAIEALVNLNCPERGLAGGSAVGSGVVATVTFTPAP